ncbi:MAG: hypothetical protein SGJ10_10090 [Bacteroidota bacterium]|nr:hypothetical protein [Bacteroidota bacterium]
MDIFSNDVFAFLKALYIRKVEYILVGGFAVNYYRHPRATGDLDLWLKDTEENRKKLIQAFGDVGVENLESLMIMPLLAGYSEIMLNNGFYIYLMADLKSIKQEQFDECLSSASNFNLEDIIIKVLHKNTLIEEKKLLGRSKDLDDVENL